MAALRYCSKDEQALRGAGPHLLLEVGEEVEARLAVSLLVEIHRSRSLRRGPVGFSTAMRLHLV